MLGKQACAVNCVPFYRGAVNSVALKQLAVQSNFPLLHKLGLAEKAAKDPTIGSVWSLAGSKIGSFPEYWLFYVILFLDFSKPCLIVLKTFLFDLCSFWAFLEWYVTACKDFDFWPLSATDQKTRNKNVSLRLACFKFQCVFFGHPYGRVQGGLKKAVLSSGNEAAHEIHPDHY